MNQLSEELIPSRSFLSEARAELAVEDLTVTTDRHILDRVTCVFRSAKLTAVMGPSGSGKTTLLNVIAGRLYFSKVTVRGKLLLNKVAKRSPKDYLSSLGFVTQEDVLPEEMTPRQILEFAAKVRLQRSEEERTKIIQTLVEQLALGRCQHTKVGTAFQKGLSGGQRKRTSIAVQLVTNPSIIILDEPTTGLDSTIALQVVLIMRRLALDGRTVVMTIHQPSVEIFRRFDSLLLLAEGRLLYQGAPTQASSFFKRQRFACPLNMNVAEYIISIVNKQGLEKGQFESRIEGMKQYFEEDRKPMELEAGEWRQEEEGRSWIWQFLLIARRAAMLELRHPKRLQTKLLQNLVVAALILIIYGELTDDLAGVRNRKGLLFLVIVNNMFNSVQGSLYIYTQERKLFLKERLSGTYCTSAYFWAKALSVLPFEVFYSVLTPAIVYYICGLHSPAANFWTFLLINVAVNWASTGYGLLLSTFLEQVDCAMMLLPAVLIPFMLFSSFFVKAGKFAVFRPVELINPALYSTQASFLNEFNANPRIDPAINPVWPGNKQQYWPASERDSLLVLLAIGLVLRTAASLLMRWISTPRALRFKKQ